MMGNRAFTEGATLSPPQDRVDMLYYRNKFCAKNKDLNTAMEEKDWPQKDTELARRPQ